MNASSPPSKKSLQRRRGQAMTEYVIIVALIAIAAIGVITLFGDNIRALFNASADALDGNEEVTPDTKGSNAKFKHKNLSTFGKNNNADN